MNTWRCRECGASNQDVQEECHECGYEHPTNNVVHFDPRMVDAAEETKYDCDGNEDPNGMTPREMENVVNILDRWHGNDPEWNDKVRAVDRGPIASFAVGYFKGAAVMSMLIVIGIFGLVAMTIR